MLNTSYAWIHADGTPGEWDHIDKEQFGLGALYRMYPTADGWIAVAALTDEHRVALFDVVASTDPATDDLRAKVLAEWFAGQTSTSAFAALDGAGVPIEIVDEQFCRTVFDDPAMTATGLIAKTSATGIGSFEDPGLLIGFSETPGVIQRGPCRCGQHTAEILTELGYTTAELAELVEQRVVLDAPA